MTSNGYKAATTDLDTIDTWWREQPDANPAIYPGAVGVLVLDLDVKGDSDGPGSLFKLELEHGPIERSFTVRTPSGGEHVYLRAQDIHSNRNKLGDAIDVRSLGGYVLAPGAVLDNGRYESAGPMPAPDRLPAAPSWTVQRCQQTKPTANGHAPGEDQQVRVQIAPAAVKETLRAIPPNVPYADWVAVACCLRTIEEQGMAGPDFDGHGLWLSWSDGEMSAPDPSIARDAETNDGHDIAADKWHHIRGSGINPRTLETIARRYGGKPQPILNSSAVGDTFASATPSATVDPWGEEEAELYRWPQPLDLEALAKYEPDPPKFIVQDWLPVGYATMLSGHGGAGKSYIGLHLAVCIATGKPWWNKPTLRKKVLVLACEDRADVLHWRLKRICDFMQVSMSELHGWLHIVDLVGQETILWNDQTGAATVAMRELRAMMDACSVDVVMIDGISDAYGANENDRSAVKAFVNSLLGLISPDSGAVFLLGHVSKPIATAESASGNGYSGSTQWHNAVRARWYLFPEQEPDEDERMRPTGDLCLELQKSNLGSASDSIGLRWNARAKMFTTSCPESPLISQVRQSEERRAIVDAVALCEEEGTLLYANRRANKNAYSTLSELGLLPDTLIGGKRVRQKFWSHVAALASAGVLCERKHQLPNRHESRILVIGSEKLN